MTDAEYIMRKDSSDKKRIGHGAYNKKGGRGPGKCRLPSDNLTKKQWEKKNGEIKTMNLNKIIPWDEFKALDIGMQRLYLENLREKYNPRQRDLADAMGIKPNTLSAWLVKYHHDFKFTNLGKSAPHSWKCFVEGKVTAVDSISEAEANKEMKEKSFADDIEDVVPVLPQMQSMTAEATNGIIHLKGDPYAVFTKAVKLFDENQVYNISISFCKEGLFNAEKGA